MEPSHLGPYKIVRKLGQGGMGAVYEGVEDVTGRRVAVKALPESFSSKSGFRMRFEVEIETLRKLDHPNIVRIYGFGEQDGQLFYSMELVEGVTLEDLVTHGKHLTWRQAVQVGIQTSKALKHAHDRGIVHRDIKPANLMMLPDGTVKLADFGIAQLYGVSGLTVEGGVVGTASYLSPEQADGQRATARSDLYSLGATLYALLAGRPPFVGKTLPELLRLQRTATPQPVRLLAPDTPPELEGILTGLLEKEPQERIPNAQTLTKSLQGVEAAVELRAGMMTGGGIGATAAGGVEATLASTNAQVPTEVSDFQGIGTFKGSNDVTIPDTDVDATPVSSTSAPSVRTEPGVTFVTAEQAAELDRQREPAKPWTIPVGSILVFILLAAVVGALVYAVVPPSADKLYSRITAAAGTGDLQQLQAVEGDIEKFRILYPHDARNAEMATYQRRLGLTVRDPSTPPAAGVADLPPDSPIQELAREARELAQTSPEQALARYKSLATLLPDDKGLSPADRDCLAQVRRQIEKLEQCIRLQSGSQLKLIQDRLERARTLMASDRKAAQAMAQAVVDLYGDKPWAGEAVEEARKIAADKSP